MSLVDIQGVNLVPGYLAGVTRQMFHISATLDAAGELCGGVFDIITAGNISKIGFRTGTVTVSDTLKISLQTVDPATGRPTGTLIDADAFGTQGSLSSNTTYWVSLQNPVAITQGRTIAVVVEFDSYAAGNLQILYGLQNYSSILYPYLFSFIGSSWNSIGHSINFGIEYDDGLIKQINNTLPGVSTGGISWDTNDNPDRRGLRFSVPYNCRMIGVRVLVNPSANFDIEIYDNDGVTLFETISVNSNLVGSSNQRYIDRVLVISRELIKDTSYRIVLHPTTGTNTTLYALSVINDGANEAMNAIDGGVNMHYTTVNGVPSTEGDYTQTLTRRPMIGLILDQLDNGVAVCDFPAVGDVEKGVEYDDGNRTGTFKEPGIANVKEGVEYGASDTEFTGTYPQNAVTGATVVGQDTTGTVTGE